MRQASIYDTTLRDGTQAEELHLTTEDKIRIARKLDELGVHYIEGGWPGSNPTDRQFFKEIKNYDLKNACVAAFGSTHSLKSTPENDPNLKAIIEAQVEAASIFGKTWDFHATHALKVSLPRNLELISGSLAFLRPNLKELFFDAEHFFDGFKANPDYALACLKAAREAGTDVLVLCDTNGGTLPSELAEIIGRVQAELPGAALGIHTHNDCELAVANSIEAVRLGAVQVQGTMNGYGERCGNANLCSIIPTLELKLGVRTIGPENLKKLATIANYVAETANQRPFPRQPYVGGSAFAHKGGIHVSAVVKNPQTYEHIDPAQVGNVSRVLLSDLAGRSNILFKARQYGYDLDKDDPSVMDLLAELKRRESTGYDYSVAEASYEILFFRMMGWSKRYFQMVNYRVLDAVNEEKEPFSEATVMLQVRGEVAHTAATGRGPVNALDVALRRALEPSYPTLAQMRLLDFKVRVMSLVDKNGGGTASYVRVLIESGDRQDRWTTVGVSHNIIEASWQALVDSINYKLFKDDPQKWPKPGGKHNAPALKEAKKG
ncbi:MAG TPA: citramalate synthase [Humidesulfovibrio sp.]|uniref:citramalate synthase n=1 Tax=Humidesulfovibrio sp. TaxID=2910988 RepID=UPI002BF53480|nr:citramalate synthase [Humidesulfovibrio sp.]HWR02421.1 citramalate synthase [Humidesulfovibrio sp.]